MMRNTILIRGFVLYIIIIILFSILYILLYAHNNKNFIFAQDISQSQNESVINSISNDIVNRKLHIEHLTNQHKIMIDTISEMRKQKYDKTNYDSYIIESGYVVNLLSFRNGCEGGIGKGMMIRRQDKPFYDYIDIEDNRGWPENNNEWINIIEDEIIKHQKEIDKNTNDLNLLCLSPSCNIWSYIDFLYFSTITQATVGYGDIMPGTSLVRFFVSLQVLIGYLILVVVVNLEISQNKEKEII